MKMNLRKILIFVMVLWFWYVTFMTISIAGAYPDARTRCLEPFQPVTPIGISGGYEFYNGANGEYLMWQIDTEFIVIDIFGTIKNCRHNPGWQPGAVTVNIPMTSDCAYFEIDNLDGGWSIVEDQNGVIILHYGEPFIVPAVGVTDPSRYRAVEIACPVEEDN